MPVISCDDFMMLYAVSGLTKVASEQGEYRVSYKYGFEDIKGKITV